MQWPNSEHNGVKWTTATIRRFVPHTKRALIAVQCALLDYGLDLVVPTFDGHQKRSFELLLGLNVSPLNVRLHSVVFCRVMASAVNLALSATW
jgi:hypothetical protein